MVSSGVQQNAYTFANGQLTQVTTFGTPRAGGLPCTAVNESTGPRTYQLAAKVTFSHRAPAEFLRPSSLPTPPGRGGGVRGLTVHGRFRIGCSGWQYRHWRGTFYPSGLPQKLWFDHYASVFDTVEINNTFYRLPEATTFDAWKTRAPAGFLFSVKASRFLTHMKKLKDPEAPLSRFFERAGHLGRKLGPVLYQLPPRWERDPARLKTFLSLLPRQYRQAIEFRDPSWYEEGTYRLLEESGVALCLHDMRGSESPTRFVGPFVYVRFHGSGPKYGGRYPDRVIADWAKRLAAPVHEGRDVYAYFNNDWGGHAPQDALRLREAIGRRTGSGKG